MNESTKMAVGDPSDGCRSPETHCGRQEDGKSADPYTKTTDASGTNRGAGRTSARRSAEGKATTDLATSSGTRRLLESLQISPRKKWGQNFLVDSTVVQRSIVLADLHPGEVIVEIGPGLGALTESLLAAGGHVYAVEIDLRLCEALRVRWAHEGRLHLSRDDAVLRPLAQLPPMTADYKVVANLPYSIANPWVNSLLESTYLPTRMVLMVQREVGERWMAVPGTKQFSPIGIFLQSAFSVTQSIAVSKRAFIPQPRVDSVLVRLDRRTEAFRFPPPFKAFLRELFTRRRQQIGRICRENKTRPEYASLAQFLAYRGLSARDRAEDCGSRFWQEYCVLLG